MITAPLSCAVTTVFRLIAPTRISMARRTTVSFRDIECLRGKRTTRRYSIYKYTNVKQLLGRACTKAVHRTGVAGFAQSSPLDEPPCSATCGRLRAATLCEQRYSGTKSVGTKDQFFAFCAAPLPSRLDGSAPKSVALKAHRRRRSSVVERGSHNP